MKYDFTSARSINELNSMRIKFQRESKPEDFEMINVAYQQVKSQLMTKRCKSTYCLNPIKIPDTFINCQEDLLPGAFLDETERLVINIPNFACANQGYDKVPKKVLPEDGNTFVFYCNEKTPLFIIR